MAEQRQTGDERARRLAPQDPWANPAVPGSDSAYGFQRGVASVGQPVARTQSFVPDADPVVDGWTARSVSARRPPLSWRLRQWRSGGEWSAAALLFVFVCWGVWAISTDGGLISPILIFLVTLVVAVGLFVLSRLLGRGVLERGFGRVRSTARGAHLVAAGFLVAVGVTHLRQTEWVMTAWRWVVGQF